ncbi:MAG TPA: hypothetical protein EYP85_14080 [Armatimonadetes bacterium]|nr:hypothetical protein [Armatimonadota bacterium]
MKWMSHRPWALVLGWWLLMGGWTEAAEQTLQHRWVYCSFNLLVEENVEKLQGVMRQAARAGYNGIVLADYKFNLLDRMIPRYFEHVARVKRTAQELGLELIPCVFPIGYSNGLLAHDPNLAEGLPVRDALFVVKNGQADLVADPPVRLRNGDFEQVNGNTFVGWKWQDEPGKITFADRQVVHRGRLSLRVENIGRYDPKHGHGRIMQAVRVAPFRQYHVSVWVKTRDFERASGVRIAVLAPDGKSLNYTDLRVKPTQEWTQHHIIFNSLSYDEVRLYLGVWGGKGGTLWWDDARLEEVGLLNVLRRPGCPLTVKGEDRAVYEEGRDFEPVRDERLGVVPWAGEYEVYHQPPVLRLTPNSRLREGQRLRVSFYHPVVIYRGQVMCCLSEPKVYDLLRDQAERVQRLLSPRGFFMSHDEMRVANWCAACQARKMRPGQLLADNVRRCVEILRAVNPRATIYVWSDMFDPFHNARGDYYLVNGSWEGSWEGLPSGVVIVNWFFRERKRNLPWFAQRGHRQILAGYYDKRQFYTPQWLAEARGVSGIIGVMYTTWRSEYKDLEGFAQAVWGR